MTIAEDIRKTVKDELGLTIASIILGLLAFAFLLSDFEITWRAKFTNQMRKVTDKENEYLTTL